MDEREELKEEILKILESIKQKKKLANRKAEEFRHVANVHQKNGFLDATNNALCEANKNIKGAENWEKMMKARISRLQERLQKIK